MGVDGCDGHAFVGEMVVDDVDLDGLQQRRRFLVYDLMMLYGEGVNDLRFQVCHNSLQKWCCKQLEPACKQPGSHLFLFAVGNIHLPSTYTFSAHATYDQRL